MSTPNDPLVVALRNLAKIYGVYAVANVASRLASENEEANTKPASAVRPQSIARERYEAPWRVKNSLR